MTSDIFNQKGKAGIEADLVGAAFEIRCPHLGSQEDRATALGYPNPANRCYKQTPPGAIDRATQAEFCLSGNHVNCPIFLEVLPPVETAPQSASKWLLPLLWLQQIRPKEFWLKRLKPEGLSQEGPRAKGVSLQKLRLDDRWKQRLRPALVIIPLLLLVLAALVWWPMPGTTVEDNTSRAAPLQKVTATEQTPELEVKESAPVPDDDGTASTPESATGSQASQPAAEVNAPVESESSPGYRVLSYD